MRLRVPLIGITLHWGSKDGGPESRVFMYGIECKALCSALVLRFEDGSRDAYHSHAFDCVSVILHNDRKLGLAEYIREETGYVHETPRSHIAGDVVLTFRETCHRVVSIGRTWVLTLRGPWRATWTDIDARTGVATTLTHGRRAAGVA